jgi:hypothetical protein
MGALSVDAEDNLGGRYYSHNEGANSHGNHTEFTLGFRPRLDPLASVLKLTFTRTGEQATAEIDLTPGGQTAPRTGRQPNPGRPRAGRGLLS